MPGPIQLKTQDRWLTLWIFLAMATGVALGNFIPAIPETLGNLSSGSTNYPIAIGLILMMYPPLAKVNYSEIGKALSNKKLVLAGLAMSWLFGPLLMFGLASMFFNAEPGYFAGLMLIAIAPCIAMVIVWNDLAGGNRELAAGLVAINSLMQVALYSTLAWFYLTWLPAFFGNEALQVPVSMREVASAVLLYLGLPFILGFASRTALIRWKGITWYQSRFLPAISPVTLYALLFTIVAMFSLKGEMILALPADLIRVAIPLLVFFLVMFFTTFYLLRRIGGKYRETTTLAFTAGSNNFELGIAVAIGIFGIHSEAAFAAVIGPLIEVPVMILLVRFALRQRTRFL